MTYRQHTVPGMQQTSVRGRARILVTGKQVIWKTDTTENSG